MNAATFWSLSVVLYEMISGDVPFSNLNYNALMQAILHQQPRSTVGARRWRRGAVADHRARARQRPRRALAQRRRIWRGAGELALSARHQGRISAATRCVRYGSILRRPRPISDPHPSSALGCRCRATCKPSPGGPQVGAPGANEDALARARSAHRRAAFRQQPRSGLGPRSVRHLPKRKPTAGLGAPAQSATPAAPDLIASRLNADPGASAQASAGSVPATQPRVTTTRDATRFRECTSSGKEEDRSVISGSSRAPQLPRFAPRVRSGAVLRDGARAERRWQPTRSPARRARESGPARLGGFRPRAVPGGARFVSTSPESSCEPRRSA